MKKSHIETDKLGHQEINELLMLVNVVLRQNYFTFDISFFIRNEGLTMGSPLTGLLVDIYINNFENKFLLSKTNDYANKIIFHARYADDTFIIFNGTTRQADNLKQYLNSINSKIEFAMETKIDNKIHFLDICNCNQTIREI